MSALSIPPAKPKNILFVHFGENWIRGSERCLIDMLKHLNKETFSGVLWCNSAALAKEAKKCHIPVYLMDFPLLFGEKKPRYDFRAFKHLVKQGLCIVDDHDISLIHSNSGAPCQWLNLVSRARKLPLVLHLHSRYPLRDRITLGLHHASWVVGVSQHVTDQLLIDGANPKRCQVIPNGIDTKALLAQPVENIRRTLNLPSDAFVVMSVCSLIHRKGVDLLIKACGELRDMCLPVHLVIVGEGEAREALQTQINQAHLDHLVHLVGEKNNVVGLMRGGVDIGISGARVEVFGLTLAEAGLASLAVIAPRVGGIASVIENHKTGLLVEPENAHALAQAIYHLYINQSERQAMGLAGYARVMNEFCIEKQIHKFETLYQTLLSQPLLPRGWLSHWQWFPPLKASYQFVKKNALLSLNKKEAL